MRFVILMMVVFTVIEVLVLSAAGGVSLGELFRYAYDLGYSAVPR